MKDITITPYLVGSLKTNCYIIVDCKTSKGIIVDPGDDASYLSSHIESDHIEPVAIVATHGHFDHILASWELQQIYHIPFYIHEEDVFLLSQMKKSGEYFTGATIVEPPPTIEKVLHDSDVIPFGMQELIVLHTPGHTPGSISLILPLKKGICVGDTVFADGSIGNASHRYSDKRKLLHSVETLLSFPPYTIIYSGHEKTETVEMIQKAQKESFMV